MTLVTSGGEKGTTSYEQLLAERKLAMAAIEEAQKVAAKARVLEIQQALGPVATQVAKKAVNTREREALVAAGKLHPIEKVLPPEIAAELQTFLKHQAEFDHALARTFQPETPAIVAAPQAPSSGWRIREIFSGAKPIQPIEPVVEVLERGAGPAPKGYTVGTTTNTHWVEGMPLPGIAVATIDGGIGEVPSRISKDGTRIEPVTTSPPTTLRLQENGMIAHVDIGTFSPIVPLKVGEAVTRGAVFEVPGNTTQMAQFLLDNALIQPPAMPMLEQRQQ